MAEEEINLPSLVIVLLITGLAVRYFFFSGNASTANRQPGGTGGLSPEELQRRREREREAAVETIQQMFPQVDRRTILWDLQRHGGNLQATTERILAGRTETPPITFQPPPPPTSPETTAAAQQSATATNNKPAEKKAHPDLITRYNLKDKLASVPSEDAGAATSSAPKTGGWSSNREERQSLLQKRRDQMIIEARRKMEAKIAAEKAAAAGNN
ncbi:hypothetical protein SMACR_00879 [Sordaria macrospora]|uniref:Coupling of ubiquitin conjugation to ER degradation protein 1 n=2 Tax=Sordaria macrospora TaxID=5147 RepID=F7VNC4_SORMK|nr:uncharacterized protein SMAC_00879 [Sordaria macrospora k-hell]KAA8630917.1 hypothetical protein SMACR_00879 [Sordaria macrospora]KAH7630765.1 hypothetical protein B0T09DRAFT_382680 [Sordaria sp. MPI-SDFR-AT-0083]WPJ62120.1 hypothetical protein SMAC4_00879 [Sordaria macrospora]CCC06853.1 unnamed protein product [Sordaria macrospora k-hell]